MTRNLVALAVLTVVGLMLVLVVAEMPEFGSPAMPELNEVPERILTRAVEETGALNAISAIILDYRAYDTLGETTVLLVAILATLAALHGRSRHGQ
jgi:multicomponent Na+:H+ antiporter subunit B